MPEHQDRREPVARCDRVAEPHSTRAMDTDQDDAFESLFSHVAYFGSAVLVAYMAAALTSHPAEPRVRPAAVAEMPAPAAVCAIEPGMEAVVTFSEAAAACAAPATKPAARKPDIVVSLQD